MEFWQRAKTFAEEAAKKTQTLTSQAKIADIVSETAKRSKEFAAEASKKADEIRAVADQSIKSLADQIPSSFSLLNSHPPDSQLSPSDLEKFGITDDIREFVRGLTSTTFLNFPVQCDLPISDVPTILNVSQDLTEWQQKHASIVLTTVQQISRLRYELCPRHMKDAKFWRIYFMLVSTHVAPYEKQYMEEIKLKEEQVKEDDRSKQTLLAGDSGNAAGVTITNQKSTTSTSSSAEQDLDTFLLGDPDDGDVVGPDDEDDAFDDGFDNSDVEDEQKL